jgi:hypothetical protein
MWVVATAGAFLLAGGLLPSAAQGLAAAAHGALGRAGFADLLVWACATTGIAVTCWVWLVTSVVVADSWRGVTTARRGVPEPLRRATLLLCGVALTGSLAGPAVAAGSASDVEVPTVLAGLRLPERVAVQPRPHPRPRQPASAPAQASRRPTVVVEPGDTLWSLTAECLGPDATDEETADAWPSLYALNREVIGPDPGLITPGQHLVLPSGHDGADR